MPPTSMTEEEIVDLQSRIRELEEEHRDLDQVISHLIDNPPPDELLVRRLKKRKLSLKEKLLKLQSMMIPDIPA